MGRTKPPSCPRCGYDQAGEIARWTTECPLEGRCTECGLVFEWVRVFRADLFLDDRTLETRVTPMNVARAVFRDAFLPWRAWWMTKLEHPAVVWRLSLILVVAFGFWRLLPGVVKMLEQQAWAQGTRGWGVGAVSTLPRIADWQWLDFDSWLWPLLVPETTAAHVNLWWQMGWPLWFWLVLPLGLAACHAAAPLVLFETRRRMQLRAVHLMRLFTYLAVPLVALCCGGAMASEVWQRSYLGHSEVVARAVLGWAVWTVLGFEVSWLCFWKRYARFETPWRDAALMQVLALVGCATFVGTSWTLWVWYSQ